MDSIEGLHLFNSILDRLNKDSHFIPLKHLFTIVHVYHAFAKEVIRLHDLLKSIIDCNKIFTCAFWRELHKLQGTQLYMSSSYHLQSDGQTEFINRALETYLRCFVSDKLEYSHEYIGRNFLTILHTIHPSRQLHSKLSMGETHLRLSIMSLSHHPYQQWNNNYKKGIKYSTS